MTEHECAAAGTGCPACAQTLAQPYPVDGPRARQVEWLAAVYEVPVCLIGHDWADWRFTPILGGAGNWGRRCQRDGCNAFQVRSAAAWAPGMED